MTSSSRSGSAAWPRSTRSSRRRSPRSRPRAPRTPSCGPAGRAAEKRLNDVREEYEGYIDVLTRGWDAFKGLFPRKIIDDETLWREIADRYGDYFDGGMGADAIKRLIDRIDLDVEEQKLRHADRAPSRGQGAVRPAPPEGDQAAQDRGRLQPPRRPRPPRQRPAGHDPRLGAGDPARAAAHGPARRWPLRHVRPQRPLPPGHQPQQPAQAAARSRRPRDHRQQREAHAAGSGRRAVRQRAAGPARDRAGQPSAQVALRHAQGQAGPLPPEPAGQACRLLGPLGHRGRSRRSSCTSAACPSSWRSSCSSRSS